MSDPALRFAVTTREMISEPGRMYPGPPTTVTTEVPGERIVWRKDMPGAYFSADGRYCVQRTGSSAVGPWVVTHDPEGQHAGWGEYLFAHCDSMKDAKAHADAHHHGVLVPPAAEIEVALV